MEVKKIENSDQVAFIMDRDDLKSLMEILNYLPVDTAIQLGTEEEHAIKVGKLYGPMYKYFIEQ